MIGIGIVTHNDVIDRTEYTENTDQLELLKHLIQTIDAYTEEEYVLVIRDNESLDFRFQMLHLLLKREFPHINSTFIRSQVNSLTDAWNEIIRICLDDFNCCSVCLLNQDILVTKYWNNFIKATKIQSRDILAPLTTASVYQSLQEVEEEDFEPADTLLHVLSVQGFCFGASRTAFKSNMFDRINYFDPEVEWDYNEEEWIQRNNNSGGRSLILENSYIIHLDQGSWIKAGLRSTKRPKKLYSRDSLEKIINVIDYNKYLMI